MRRFTNVTVFGLMTLMVGAIGPARGLAPQAGALAQADVPAVVLPWRYGRKDSPMIRIRVLALLVLSLALLGTLAAPTLAAPGANSAAAAACEGEGYRNYTDAEGRPFKNAGQCMKHVAHAGTLEEKPFLTIVWVDTGEVGNEFGGTLTGGGLLPGATVWSTITEQGGFVTTLASRVVDSDGTLHTEYGHQPCVLYQAWVFETLDRYGNVIQASAPLPC